MVMISRGMATVVVVCGAGGCGGWWKMSLREGSRKLQEDRDAIAAAAPRVDHLSTKKANNSLNRQLMKIFSLLDKNAPVLPVHLSAAHHEELGNSKTTRTFFWLCHVIIRWWAR